MYILSFVIAGHTSTTLSNQARNDTFESCKDRVKKQKNRTFHGKKPFFNTTFFGFIASI
jgi:hypothetical protein